MTPVGVLAVDEVEQVGDAVVVDLLLDRSAKGVPRSVRFSRGIAEVLGERAFPRAEEPGDPDAIPSCGSDGASANALKSWWY